MTLKIDLKDWTIYINTPSLTEIKMKDGGKNKISCPIKAILLYLMQQVGYFERAGFQPQMDIFKAVLVPSE